MAIGSVVGLMMVVLLLVIPALLAAKKVEEVVVDAFSIRICLFICLISLLFCPCLIN